MVINTHSFASRLTRRIIVALILIMIVISVICSLLTISTTTNQIKTHYQETATLVNERMENLLTSVEVTVNNNIDRIESCIDKPETIYATLEDIVKKNPHITACGIPFIADFYPNKGHWFEPYAIRKSDGTIEKKQIGSEQHDYLHSEWFNIAYNLKSKYWSNPYFDNAGAKSMLCSYFVPIHDRHGNKVGLFGIDLSLEGLKNQIKDLDQQENQKLWVKDSTDRRYAVYSFIIGQNGRYIVHPDKERILNQSFFTYAEKTADKKDDMIGQSMLKGEEGSAQVTLDGINSFIFYNPIHHTNWSIAIVVPRATMYHLGFHTGLIFMVLMTLCIIAILFICHISIRKGTKPLVFLAKSAEEVAKGRFNTSLPIIKHNDEIRQLRDSFEEMQKSLTLYVDQLKSTTAQKASIERELNIARNIQMAMLPKLYPPYPERNDIDVYGTLMPAKAVGGDLYDFYIRDEKLFFCIGDVSGKGIPASLVMAVIRTLFRIISGQTAEPDRIVSILNKATSEDNETNMFVTLFVGALDLPTGRLRYCNAGHNAPLIINKKVSMLPCNPNIPIGAMPDWSFSAQNVLIQPGTMIFLYTDGLTEAEDKDCQQFGMERIYEVISPSQQSPSQLVNDMTNAVHLYVNGAEQSDDLTMLAIRYTKEQLEELFERDITLQNDIQEIEKLTTFIDEVCEAIGMDSTTTMKMNLAIEEAVVNVISYGYRTGAQGEVNIKAQANSVRLKFVITDNGKPFDPTTRPEIDTTLSADERDIGGLGIHLIRRIMDSMNYERMDDKNILTLNKNIN